MGQIYFNPGCALSIYKPDLEKRILTYLKENIDSSIGLHQICCRHEPSVAEGSTIINVCAGCDRRFGRLYQGVSTISLWEVLDRTDSFVFPDYAGIQMSVHDACPVRGKPAVHAAVRSLLAKMKIEIVEAEQCGQQSVCCGDSYYPALPLQDVRQKMRERAAAMPSEQVAVYCVSCIKAMSIGGKAPRHLADLLFGVETASGVCDLAEWHEQLQAYIDAH